MDLETMQGWDDGNRNALDGLIQHGDQPVKKIADLLRSGASIEPEVRKMLADAIEGLAHTDWLNLEARPRGTQYRKERTLLRKLGLGEKVRSIMNSGYSYAEAVPKVAEAMNVGVKTVEAGYTEFKKRQDWMAEEANLRHYRPMNAAEAQIERWVLERDYIAININGYPKKENRI